MKRPVLTILLCLFLSEAALAQGPLQRFFRRFSRPRTRQYYSQPNIEVPVSEEVPENGELNVETIQWMHQMDCQYRNSHGLKSLILHSKLCEVAQAHAENMARNNNMSHYLGGAPWDRAFALGWPNSASENIARGYTTVSAAYGGWYSSRGHRINMLGDHKYCGFGHSIAANGQHFWAAMYSD